MRKIYLKPDPSAELDLGLFHPKIAAEIAELTAFRPDRDQVRAITQVMHNKIVDVQIIGLVSHLTKGRFARRTTRLWVATRSEAVGYSQQSPKWNSGR
jgi:uncharacterized protein YciW